MTTGDDFIELANQLVNGKSPMPAALRTGISRAYYGAYHLTLQFLSSISVTPGSTHNLDHFLCNTGNEDANQAGKILKDLQSDRVRADYKLDRLDIESLKSGQLALNRAREFRSYLDRCRAEPAISAIKAGIEAYRQRIGPRG